VDRRVEARWDSVSIEMPPGTEETLPLKPSRDNSGRGCEFVPESAENDRLPDHITACECETHDGVCEKCNYKITIGSEGTEYGHARATNKGPNSIGDRVDCKHRPDNVDPGGGSAR